MKRLFALLFVALLILSGCSSNGRTDITPEEIAAAYQEAGYTVSIDYYDETLEYGQIGYIKAEHTDGDYIYFTVFESEEAADAYKDEFYHPGVTGLFSMIFGDPSLLRMEVCGCIVAEYDHSVYAEPFEALMKST